MGRRSDSGRGESFTTGFICGGLVFGALGFIFAPQVGSCSHGKIDMGY